MNKEKFKELNRLWVNQGLYSYVSRPLFGSAPNMMMPNFGIIPGPGAGVGAMDPMTKGRSGMLAMMMKKMSLCLHKCI